jgi:hypothetical protein
VANQYEKVLSPFRTVWPDLRMDEDAEDHLKRMVPWLPDDADPSDLLPAPFPLFKEIEPDIPDWPASEAALAPSAEDDIIHLPPSPNDQTSNSYPESEVPPDAIPAIQDTSRSPEPASTRSESGPPDAAPIRRNRVARLHILDDDALKRVIPWLADDTDLTGVIPANPPIFKPVFDDSPLPSTPPAERPAYGARADSADLGGRVGTRDAPPDAHEFRTTGSAGDRTPGSDESSPEGGNDDGIADAPEYIEVGEEEDFPDVPGCDGEERPDDHGQDAAQDEVDEEPGDEKEDIHETPDGPSPDLTGERCPDFTHVNDQRGEDTPQSVKTALLGLGGCVINGKDGLKRFVKLVHDASRYALPEFDGRLVVSLFAARHTGPSCVVQQFGCTRRDCPAGITFDRASGRAQVNSHNFHHNHLIRQTTRRGLFSLSNEQREQVRQCVKQNMTSAAIHKSLPFDIDPQVLADAKRDVLTRDREGEVQLLLDAIKHWDDFSYQPLTDEMTKRFGGCYFFHKVLANTTACTDVLAMDDTACTNHFGLPLFVVIGSDEHGRNQVIAFAFLVDRSAERFAHFLNWLAPQLGGVPRAIVVDRHEGQAKAIREVFPTTQLVFCAKHLAANIAQWFGKKAKIVGQFWQLMKCKTTEAKWLEYLTELDSTLVDNTPQKRMVQWLRNNVQHYSPEFTFQFTSHQVSARVEGFFGTLKTRLEHQTPSLCGLANAVRGLARNLVRKRLQPRTKLICGADILALPDQFRLGRGAAKALQAEVVFVRKFDWRKDTFDRAGAGKSCRETAFRHKLPCRHLMLQRASRQQEGVPLLTLADFPPQVLLPTSISGRPLRIKLQLTSSRACARTVTNGIGTGLPRSSSPS